MNMRLTAFLLMICMLLTMTGCRGAEEAQPSDTLQTTAPAETTAETVAAGYVGLEDPAPAEAGPTKPMEAPEETVEVPTEAPEEEPIEETKSPASGSDQAVEAPEVVYTEYERFMDMSGAEQKAFMESFASVEEFFDWLNQAREEYEQLHPGIEVENGVVDLTKGNG